MYHSNLFHFQQTHFLCFLCPILQQTTPKWLSFQQLLVPPNWLFPIRTKLNFFPINTTLVSFPQLVLRIVSLISSNISCIFIVKDPSALNFKYSSLQPNWPHNILLIFPTFHIFSQLKLLAYCFSEFWHPKNTDNLNRVIQHLLQNLH